MVYGLYRALPGDRLSCHRRQRKPADLTPAPRRQDHTTLPSALASPVKRAVASTAPRPASVTFAKRPSEWDGMAMDIDSIWGGGEAEYFLNEVWTGQITLNAFKKLVFARRAFRRKLFVPKADQFTYPARPGKSDAGARSSSSSMAGVCRTAIPSWARPRSGRRASAPRSSKS
jgi:hypothetical protein